MKTNYSAQKSTHRQFFNNFKHFFVKFLSERYLVNILLSEGCEKNKQNVLTKNVAINFKQLFKF